MLKFIIHTFTLFLFIESFSQKKPVEEINKLITQSESEAHMSFLSSDEMRGRVVGSYEVNIAAAYIASYFKQQGLKPVAGATNFYQKVEMEKSVGPANATLKLDTSVFQFKKNFLVVRGGDVDWKGEFVFVGYGSEQEMNESVKDKIVVAMSGAKDMDSQRRLADITLQKAERASKLGAVALIEILTTPPYPWPVLSNILGSGPRFVLQHGAPEIPVVWLKDTEAPVVTKLKSLQKLNGSLSIFGIKRTAVDTRNVIGILEGSDPVLKNEYLAVSAHYDHVGVGKPVAGDSIYNGARDNAAGTAGLLATVKFFSNFRPKRSVVFIALTAEEKGLLGSAWYADHPLIPLNQTVFNFNSDGAGYNDKSIVTINGLEKTTAESFLQEASSAFNLKASLDPVPEQNLYERSDNYNFAKKGVPAINFAPGIKAFDEELSKYYHKPADEMNTLDMSYMMQYIKAYVYANYLIANSDKTPWWKSGDKYEALGKTLYKK